MGLPFSVKNRNAINQLGVAYCRLTGSPASFIANMVVKAESDDAFAADFQRWIDKGDTVFLRDTLLPQMLGTKPIEIKSVDKCGCCGRVRETITTRKPDAFHDLDWEGLDTAHLNAGLQ